MLVLRKFEQYSNSFFYRHSSLMNSWTKYELHRTRTSIKIFKSMQILSIQFNNCFRTVLMPITNLFVLGVHIACIFASVKFHSVLELPFMLAFACGLGLCFTFEFITYPLMGSVYENSVAFVNGPDENSDKEWRRVKRALPALGFSVGGCHSIRKQSVLSFTSLVCTMASNLLVSTG